MRRRLSKKEKKIIDNLDRLLAGEPAAKASGFLEEKLLQVLKTYEYTEEKRAGEQENIARLISDMSHQLKTPLSALSLHLELAEDASLNEAERSLELKECRIQADKIRFFSEAIFKAARLESGLISVQRAKEDIIPTVRSAIDAMHPALEAKGLSLKVHMPEVLIVPHDPVWTKEALMNLIDNAVKYTDSGGITITAEQGAIYTRIDIADTGIGIAPEEYPKIFSRFYRARHTGTKRVEGTGLGLSIAREILRQQGGNITVASGEAGSTFSVFLQNC